MGGRLIVRFRRTHVAEWDEARAVAAVRTRWRAAATQVRRGGASARCARERRRTAVRVRILPRNNGFAREVMMRIRRTRVGALEKQWLFEEGSRL